MLFSCCGGGDYLAERKNLTEQAARKLLKMKLPEDCEIYAQLVRYGLEATGAQAMMFAQFQKALNGDGTAAKLIREAAGEKLPPAAMSIPVQAVSAEKFASLTDEQLRELIGGEA